MIENDTLIDGEQRWRPVVLITTAACLLFNAVILALTWYEAPRVLWLLATAITCLPLASNARQLLKNGTTVGMIPILVCSLMPTTLVGVATLWPHRIIWWLCTLGFLFSTGLCLWTVWWFARISSVWRNQPPVDSNAVIIVLGGIIRNGIPVETVQNRLRVAADLLREEQGRLCILSGGVTEDGTTTEAEAMRNWLMGWEGIAADQLILEPKAVNTSQNIQNSFDLVHKRGLDGRQICIVSSDYHLYRALSSVPATATNITCVPAPVPLGSRPQQWCREVLIVAFKSATSR